MRAALLCALALAAASAARVTPPPAAAAAAVDSTAGPAAAATPLNLTLAAALDLRPTSPWGALELLERALNTTPAPAAGDPAGANDAARLLEATADTLTLLKRPGDAQALRARALRLRTAAGAPPMARIKALVAIAQDLRDARRYDEALGAVGEALAAVGGGEPAPAAAAAAAAAPPGVPDAPALRAVLQRARAALLDCQSDVLGALRVFAGAQRAAEAAGDDTAGASAHLLRHLSLLRRAFAGGDRHPKLSAPGSPMAALFRRQEEQITRQLLARGPWVDPAQLPHGYVPGLAARPWHTLQQWPHLAPVVAALTAARGALAAEFAALAAAGRLEPEAECIHDAASGAWRTYMANAGWRREVDAHGCSAHTPVACALLRNVSALPGAGGADARVRPLRAGYSAVGARARLLPHHGLTNAQLKFHVGLVVPAVGGGAYTAASAARGRQPCATIRVGNETRAWTQGGVLFFDDSFEHEVWNACDAERVVLQLVVAHPDLAGSGQPDPFRNVAGVSH